MEAAWSVSLLFSCLGNLLADRLHMLQVCCWAHQGGEFGTFTTALGSNRGVASALASHVVPLTRSHGEVDVNKMEVSMVLQHAVATCLTGRTRLFWSRWEGRLGQHVIPPPHRELEVTFYISVGSSMPANISLKPRRLPECLSHWLLWSSSDVIIPILNRMIDESVSSSGGRRLDQ